METVAPPIPVPAAEEPPVALIAGGALLVIIIIVVVVVLMNKKSGPPVDCVVGPWKDSGSCSKICGPGKQRQTRDIITPAENGGAACPSLSQEIDCNLRPCNNIDCTVSPWSPYNTDGCFSTRENKTRSRTITNQPEDYGAACPSLTESVRCTASEVDATCNYTLVEDLSKCRTNSRTGWGSRRKTTKKVSTVPGCPDIIVSRNDPCDSQTGTGGGGNPPTATAPPVPAPSGMVSTTLTANPTYTCPRNYTLITTNAVGSKCTKGRRTETETVVCPSGYTFNSSTQLCTKVVYTPAPTPVPVFTPAPAPTPVPVFTPAPAPSGSTGVSGYEAEPTFISRITSANLGS
jgi:hypothetical protein